MRVVPNLFTQNYRNNNKPAFGKNVNVTSIDKLVTDALALAAKKNSPQDAIMTFDKLNAVKDKLTTKHIKDMANALKNEKVMGAWTGVFEYFTKNSNKTTL